MGLKIEVGKAYRTRGGEKVTVIKYDDRGLWSFIGDNKLSYASDGYFRDLITPSYHDLIAPWEDESSKPKYKAGDKVEIELTESIAESWNQISPPIKIISHTPAPEPEFDWSTVKAGMAFVTEDAGQVIYVARLSGENRHIVKLKHTGGHYIYEQNQLTRAPEHDITI